MAAEWIFIGRKEDRKEFAKVLEDQRGQAIIVVGNRGIVSMSVDNEIYECNNVQ
jgi:hypothetical protein